MIEMLCLLAYAAVSAAVVVQARRVATMARWRIALGAALWPLLMVLTFFVFLHDLPDDCKERWL